MGEWSGHLTFASELIVALEPSLIVELGTHWGEAYFTFCQTVQEHGLSSLCYAVDHWEGDEHAGHYGEEVFDEVSGYNDRLYKQFSYLLRRSFDDAAAQFADDSIALLHIDGLHTYEAVKHDFENWLPKVQPGGVVLFHDICPRHQDFGVWRLWDEIKAEFPDTFEFHHSWGLGVLRKPGNVRTAPLLEYLFHSSPEVQEEVRRHYVICAFRRTSSDFSDASSGCRAHPRRSPRSECKCSPYQRRVHAGDQPDPEDENRRVEYAGFRFARPEHPRPAKDRPGRRSLVHRSGGHRNPLRRDRRAAMEFAGRWLR